MLKTDPSNSDSDCDNIDDASEVGTVATPANSDNDSVIDALENNDADSDGNGSKDNLDTTPAIQITCGRFKPFAILNNNSDTTRVEVRVTGANISAVSMPFPDNGLLVDGALVTSGAISLYDDGTHGDQQTGDGL